MRTFNSDNVIYLICLCARSEDCYESGVHRHPKAGIQGSKISGACSIVVSGKYDDDKDLGDTMYAPRCLYFRAQSIV